MPLKTPELRPRCMSRGDMDLEESKNIQQGRIKEIQMKTVGLIWEKALSILENLNN